MSQRSAQPRTVGWGEGGDRSWLGRMPDVIHTPVGSIQTLILNHHILHNKNRSKSINAQHEGRNIRKHKKTCKFQVASNFQTDPVHAFWKANKGGNSEPSKNPRDVPEKKTGFFHGEENQAVDFNNAHYHFLWV